MCQKILHKPSKTVFIETNHTSNIKEQFTSYKVKTHTRSKNIKELNVVFIPSISGNQANKKYEINNMKTMVRIPKMLFLIPALRLIKYPNLGKTMANEKNSQDKNRIPIRIPKNDLSSKFENIWLRLFIILIANGSLSKNLPYIL